MKMYFPLFLLGLLAAGFPSSMRAQAKPTSVIATRSEKKEPAPVEISAFDNKIVVENAPIGSKLEIYSVVGIRVKEIVMKQPSGEYTVDIAKGYYIVRIGDIVRKVAIR